MTDIVSKEEHMRVAQTVEQHGQKMTSLQDLVKSNANSINRLEDSITHMGDSLFKKIDQINNRGQMSPAILISIFTFLLIVAGGMLTLVTVVNKPTTEVAIRNEMELQEYRKESKREAYNNGVRDARLDAQEEYIKLIDQRGSRHLGEVAGQ